MIRRRHFCTLLAVSTAGCQLQPVPSSSSPGLAMTDTTKARLAKAGVKQCERVAAYLLNQSVPSPSPSLTLLIDGKLNPDRSPLEGRTLDDREVNTLLDATTGKNHPSPHARCFFPRHAVAFYTHDGNMVAHMDICFSCLGYRAQGVKVVREPDYKALKRLF